MSNALFSSPATIAAASASPRKMPTDDQIRRGGATATVGERQLERDRQHQRHRQQHDPSPQQAGRDGGRLGFAELGQRCDQEQLREHHQHEAGENRAPPSHGLTVGDHGANSR
jgi:hypothetical protein